MTAKTLTTADILTNAAGTLEANPGFWHKGDYLKITDAGVVGACTAGLIYLGGRPDPDRPADEPLRRSPAARRAVAILLERLDLPVRRDATEADQELSAWNDDPARTVEDVINALRSAAKECWP